MRDEWKMLLKFDFEFELVWNDIFYKNIAVKDMLCEKTLLILKFLAGTFGLDTHNPVHLILISRMDTFDLGYPQSLYSHWLGAKFPGFWLAVRFP